MRFKRVKEVQKEEHGFWKLIYLLRVNMGFSKKEVMRMSLAEAEVYIWVSIWENKYASELAEEKLQGERVATAPAPRKQYIL